MDVQKVYNEFLDVVKFYIDHCIPMKTVRMGRSDPEFITPHIESLLNKRNKLRKQGKYDLADNLANKINVAVANTVRNQLSKPVDSPVHAMWDAIRNQNNAREYNTRTSHLLNDVERVNAFLPAFQMTRRTKLKMYQLTVTQRSVTFNPFMLMRSSPYFGRL